MFKSVRSIVAGFGYHGKGIRFAFGQPVFLALSAVPFVVALALYSLGFYLFTLHAESLLNSLWSPEAVASSWWLWKWLHWIYLYVVQILLYALLLVLMLYSFIIFTNVLASPLYSYVAARYEQRYHGHAAADRPSRSLVREVALTVVEEMKKALFMLAVPLMLLFVPVVGPPLAFVVSALFIAWDYTDYSLSRDHVRLADRLRVIWRHRSEFLGFGSPMLVPFFGLLLMPFAVLGATMLYYERLRDQPAPVSLAKDDAGKADVEVVQTAAADARGASAVETDAGAGPDAAEAESEAKADADPPPPLRGTRS